MNNFRSQEERFPLLMLFLDDSSKSKNKRKAIFIDKSRYRNIANGASAVLTDWPTHLTGCWLTTLLAIITLTLFLLIIFAASIRPIVHTFLPRCPTGFAQHANSTKIFLAHRNEPLDQSELDSIEEMIQVYPNCQIHLTLFFTIDNDLLTMTINKLRQKRSASTELPLSTTAINQNQNQKQNQNQNLNQKQNQKQNEKQNQKQNLSVGSLLDFLVEEGKRRRNVNKRKIIVEKVTAARKLGSLEELLSTYANVECKNVSTKDIFQNSPLYGVYERFSPELTTFAVRILQLWDYGGISFALPEMGNGSNRFNNVMRLIKSGYDSYQKLDNGFVTIDDEGLHMETKTTCHAFFGEMLHYLKRATSETTSKQIIKQTLKSFCGRQAVDAEYCKNLT